MMKVVVCSTLVTGVAALMLALFLHLLRGPAAWPSPESPPRQGEALDPGAYASGRIVHSPEALARVIREPMNAWSNLAFIWVGTLVLLSTKGLLPKQSGVALIAVGLGSFLYHASASRTLRQLDVGAMYWMYGVLCLLSFGIFFPGLIKIATRLRYGIVMSLPLAAIAVTVFRNVRVVGWKPFDLSLVTGSSAAAAIAALVLLAWRLRTLSGWLKTGVTLILFGVAVAFQIGDRPGGWACDPSALIQAHSLWHILGALACGLACWRFSLSWTESLDLMKPAVAISRAPDKTVIPVVAHHRR